jgi:hypothetical protein
MPQHQTDWQHLAEKVSRETDPKKMLRLVEELNRVFSEGRKAALTVGC